MRFAAWKAASPAHERAYEELRLTWDELRATGPLVRAVAFGQSMIAAAKPRRRIVPWAIAASACLAVIAALVVWRVMPQSTEAFRTAVGEHASMTLADGSKVDLNSNSNAHVDYGRRSRRVHLERGEGYFRVSHDSARPFWVMTDRAWVRAVGTEFNVEMRGDDVRVTVIDGSVKVGSVPAERGDSRVGESTGVSGTTVIADQQVDLNGSTVVSVRTLTPVQIARTVSWRTGVLNFENEPLSEVAAELSRYTPLKIVIRSPELKSLPVGGTFDASTRGAEALVSMLRDGFDLSVTRSDGVVYVDRKQSPSN
jgi:transmembrane sensor